MTALLKARKSSDALMSPVPPAALQCDRAFEGAEVMDFTKYKADKTLLQCDRAFEGAEVDSIQQPVVE